MVDYSQSFTPGGMGVIASGSIGGGGVMSGANISGSQIGAVVDRGGAANPAPRRLSKPLLPGLLDTVETIDGPEEPECEVSIFPFRC